VDGSDHAAAGGNPEMLDERTRIPVRGYDGQLAVGGGNRKRGHPTRHRLHNVMQDNFTNCSKTGGIGERSREVLRDDV
jgi:hypothetical protein